MAQTFLKQYILALIHTQVELRQLKSSLMRQGRNNSRELLSQSSLSMLISGRAKMPNPLCLLLPVHMELRAQAEYGPDEYDGSPHS